MVSPEQLDWMRSTMARDAKTKPSLKLPHVMPGDWRGEILGGCTVNFGQVVQPGPPRQSVEFTYVIMPAAFSRSNETQSTSQKEKIRSRSARFLVGIGGVEVGQ
jgi:hypothetical protein